MSRVHSQSADLEPLHVADDGEVIVLSFPRAADGRAVRAMYETAAQCLERRNLKMLVDLTGLRMVSSGMMGMLVTIRKKMLSVGGQLHIAAPDPRQMEEFHIMNLHLLLSLFPSVDEARARFKA